MEQAALDLGSTAPLPPIPAAAQQLLGLGVTPIRVQYRAKAPTHKDWPNFRTTAADVPLVFRGECNLGALLGDGSAGLVDVDLDWTEAEQLAPRLLPKSWAVGRVDGSSFRLRHVLLRSPGAGTAKFDAPAELHPKKSRRIVELLSTGAQVVVPPSVHPSGQELQWRVAPEDIPLAELHADELARTVARLAGAALLARHWAEFEGTRHDIAAALAGACHHAGWTRQDTEQVLGALLVVAEDSEKRDRARAISDTLERAAAGEAVTGLPRLADLLGVPLTTCIQRWWELGQNGAVLTFGGRTAEQAQAAAPPEPDTAWVQGMGWPELLEFESGTEYEAQLREYPLDALGPVLGPAAEALAYLQQTPVALAVQSVLAAAATVVQSRFDVLCDGRAVPLSLWLALVAAPGERKTTTDMLAFQRIVQRMREAELQYQVALEAWTAAKGDRDMGDPGPKPRKPSWLLTDTTTEGMLKTLDRHWPALTLTNSDAATWVSGYSMREGRDSSTAATLSQLWSGAFHATARASMDAPSTLHGRRLSLSLMLQPALAAQLFESATLSGQGFLSRCLPAFPPSTIGNRKYRLRQSDARLGRFEQALDTLLAQPVPMNPITGELQPQPLELGGTALAGWIAAHDRYETELLGRYGTIQEVANKAPEQVLRLAGLQAAIEGSAAVSAAQVSNAVRLVDWYTEEWLQLSVRLVEHRKDVMLPRQLWDWMRKRRDESGQDVFNLREMYKDGPRIVRGKSQLARELVVELLRRGYVRPDGKDYQLRPEDA